MVLMLEMSSDHANVELFPRKIEFHKARKPFNGIVCSGGGGGFEIETLNPGPDHKKQLAVVGGGGSGRNGDVSGFAENNGLDPELCVRITIRRIGAGLENLGNTCFLNSVLQCLTYTEPLAAYLQSGKHKNSCHIAGFCALCAIQTHVSRALQSTGRSLAPKDLVSNLRCISRNFRNARQEDAHEYMVNLLESMHKCCLPSGVPSESPGAYEKSLVHKIFGGRLRSRVRCTQCSYCSDKFDPFLDLSLEIFKAESLHKALQNFSAAELLDGGEKQYHCQQCKKKVKARKQLTVDKAPHVLTVHLKRFRSHDGQKIDKKVAFESTLDMKPFVTGSDGGDLKYTLYGVLVHYGWSTHSGHYSCFIRTSSGMWYSLDDSRVAQVSEKAVLGQKAYMLFYGRDRKNFVPGKSVDILQKENLKDVNRNKVCFSSIANQQKAVVENGSSKKISVKEEPHSQNNKRVVVESSMLKMDPKAEPALSAHLAKNPSEISFNAQKAVVDDGSSKKISVKEEPHSQNNKRVVGESSVPKTDLKVEPALSAHLAKNPSDSKINDCLVNGVSKTNLGVQVYQSSSGVQNSAGDKLDICVTSPKMNIVSHDEVGRTAERLPHNASATNIAEVRLPNKSICEKDQIGGIFTSNISEDSASEKVGGISQNAIPESVALSASEVVTNESLHIRVQDSTPQKKLKKKSRKCQITHMHVGLKIFKSSLGLRKNIKHKRTKSRTRNISGHLFSESSISQDLMPSTSEVTSKTSSVSSCSRKKHSKKSFSKSDDYSSMDIINGDLNDRQKSVSKSDDYSSRKKHSKKSVSKSDDYSSLDIINGDLNDRQNQNGVILATKQNVSEPSKLMNWKLNGSVPSITESNQQDASEPSKLMNGKLNGSKPSITEANQQNASEPSKSMNGKQNGAVRKHAGDLQETAVPRWDGIGMSSTTKATQSTSIGYVLDEWDEEYDLGKKKKVKLPKLIFDGPNPFQEISTQRSKFKKAKLDRTNSSNQPFRI